MKLLECDSVRYFIHCTCDCHVILECVHVLTCTCIVIDKLLLGILYYCDCVYMYIGTSVHPR